MKLLYYSELLDEAFDTESELIRAEQAHKDKLAAKEEAEASLKASIDLAQNNLDEARERYAARREEALQILTEALQKADEILTPEAQAIHVAEKEKREALEAFNEHFSPDVDYCSDNEAYNEIKKGTDWMSSFLKDFFY